MNLLAGQSNVHMVADTSYAAAQASAVMVAAVDRVGPADVNEMQLKTLQGTVASIREEL